MGKSRKSLIKVHQPLDLTLFAVEPDKRRRYVANIREAEVLDDPSRPKLQFTHFEPQVG